ncbi:hypothetical protein EUBHAL_02932 [Anaerobutyricum hallii DSM 3353]|uniref:Uncharacterized protein n=1 Tax=Anaerobutyricum hallii DSM 3353 TaxID=411469 RepID=C0EZS1_9FIRM|nr:hypothetical protein EUBHAL_02932 [Anaerobutyricum hallii DSM 3353]
MKYLNIHQDASLETSSYNLYSSFKIFLFRIAAQEWFSYTSS